MATLQFLQTPHSILSCCSSYSPSRTKLISYNKPSKYSFHSTRTFTTSKFVCNSSKEEENSSSSSSTTLVQDEKNDEENKKQEEDWKGDEDFKNKFMGNLSIETAVKLEKKRTERRLQELEKEAGGNFLQNVLSMFRKNTLAKERERLQKAEEAFKALDLNKLKSCFGFDTFFAVDVRRFGDGGIFVGNLRRPIEEVIPKLEKKLADVAGREVVLWFMEEQVNDITKQVCVVQPKSEIDLQLEFSKLNTPYGYVSALLLGIATLGTIALTSGFFLKPDATFDDYIRDVIPLFGGFITILGVSEGFKMWEKAIKWDKIDILAFLEVIVWWITGARIPCLEARGSADPGLGACSQRIRGMIAPTRVFPVAPKCFGSDLQFCCSKAGTRRIRIWICKLCFKVHFIVGMLCSVVTNLPRALLQYELNLQDLISSDSVLTFTFR